MTQKSGYFKMSESPFKVFECCDLNTPTPKSSTRAQKKLFTCSSDRQEQRTAWSEVFVSKHFCSINTHGLITPPAVKLSTMQPPAPTKPRKYMNKIDLKPRKLIFKDVEEPESDTVDLPVIFQVHSDENIPEKKSGSGKHIGNDMRLKGNRRKIINDDKENRVGSLHVKSKTNLVKTPNGSSLPQRQTLNINRGTKHFRV